MSRRVPYRLIVQPSGFISDFDSSPVEKNIRSFYSWRMSDLIESAWHVYILHCADGSYYVGCTNRLAERIATHNTGKGAKYTSGRRPVVLAYSEPVHDRSAALKREIQIKKWSRSRKQALIECSRGQEL